MSIRFNAYEVFLMAETMERNASAFYRRAAELHPNEHNQQFLQKLAGMEDGHLVIFKALRAKLAPTAKEETAYDPFNESLMYLEAMAETQKAEGSPEARAALTGKETMEQILRLAVQLEGRAILFYAGIRDLVPEKLGRDKVDDILREEKSHVVLLSGELKTLLQAKK